MTNTPNQTASSVPTATELMDEIMAQLSSDAVNNPRDRDGLMRAIEIVESVAWDMGVRYGE